MYQVTALMAAMSWQYRDGSKVDCPIEKEFKRLCMMAYAWLRGILRSQPEL